MKNYIIFALIILILTLFLFSSCTIDENKKESTLSNDSNIQEDEIVYTDEEPIYAYSGNNINEFVEWIENGGDKESQNKMFLDSIKQKNEILIPIVKNERFNKCSISVLPDSNRYVIHFEAPLVEGDADQQMFLLNFVRLSEDDLKLSLKDTIKVYYNYYFKNGAKFHTVDEKGSIPQYIYTNFELNETKPKKEGFEYRRSFSEAWFINSGYLINLQILWRDRNLPFNDEYLEYLDYKLVQLNIKE